MYGTVKGPKYTFIGFKVQKEIVHSGTNKQNPGVREPPRILMCVLIVILYSVHAVPVCTEYGKVHTHSVHTCTHVDLKVLVCENFGARTTVQFYIVKKYFQLNFDLTSFTLWTFKPEHFQFILRGWNGHLLQ